MLYGKVVEGVFIERPNRFVAVVEIDGERVFAHVKNTGRCRELLTFGSTVYLEDFSQRSDRKLKYSLVAVLKNDLLINMDSQAPNKVALEGIKGGAISLKGFGKIAEIQAEKTFDKSRFDIYIKDEEGREGFVEVKGVTLEENGVVKFPDAPTERGVKHLKELILAKSQGYYAAVLFVVQMKGVKYFTPNAKTHEAFAIALKEAKENGVEILAYTSNVSKEGLSIEKQLPIIL